MTNYRKMISEWLDKNGMRLVTYYPPQYWVDYKENWFKDGKKIEYDFSDDEIPYETNWFVGDTK